MSRSRLELSAVGRVYTTEAEEIHALRDIDLIARTGEFVCFHGTSGSGKTTLLNVIGGLDIPSSGTVILDGLTVSSLAPEARIRLRREVVGVVHQDDGLVEEFTATENVALPLEVNGSSPEDARAAAIVALGQVGMDDMADRFPRQLSGGQRQRVGVARALIGDRRILLADEPTGSLDSGNAAKIYQLLRDLADSGVLVLVASHDPECRSYADRVVEMADGTFLSSAKVSVPWA